MPNIIRVGVRSQKLSKRRYATVALALLVLVGFGCQSQPDPLVTMALNGRLTYQRHCLTCHGSQGNGAGSRMINPPVPDLLSGPIREKMNRGQIRMHDGQSGGVLGAWRLPLGAQEASDVIQYVRLLQASQMGKE